MIFRNNGYLRNVNIHSNIVTKNKGKLITEVENSMWISKTFCGGRFGGGISKKIYI